MKVRLNDDSVYCGAVRTYTRDPQESQREMFLYPVFELDQNEQPGDEIEGVGVLVPSGSIRSVEVLDWADQEPEV